MSLELTCQLLLYFGLPLNKIIKHRAVFSEIEFLELIKEGKRNEVIIWDDSPFLLNPRHRDLEKWAFWGWYLFQRWVFKNG